VIQGVNIAAVPVANLLQQNSLLPWFCAVLLAVATALSRILTGNKQTKWLINPIADFLLPCGGLVWLMLSLSVTLLPSINPAGNQLFDSASLIKGGASANTMVLVAGALLFTDTHFGTGFIRTFKRQFQGALWPYWGPVFVITITAAFLAHSEMITVWSCKFYLFVVVLHYAQQSLSLLLRYARINGCPWEGCQKILLTMLIYAVAARTLIAQLIDPSLNVQQFLGLPMPQFTPLPESMFQSCELLVVVATSAVAAIIFKRALLKEQACPLPFCFLLLNVLLVFSYLGEFSGLLWVFVPAFFHAAQSIAETIHSNVESADKMKPVPMLAGSFILGGFIMWIVPGFLHSFGIAANLAYPAVVVAASVWHFYCEHIMSLETCNR
jgi:hypothetical protein